MFPNFQTVNNRANIFKKQGNTFVGTKIKRYYFKLKFTNSWNMRNFICLNYRIESSHLSDMQKCKTTNENAKVSI